MQYKLELITFLSYFFLSQIILPLSIPKNPNIGPVSSWRLFSLSYGDYSRDIIDFPCLDSPGSFLLKDKVEGLSISKMIGKEPSQLLKEPLVIQAIRDCQINGWVKFKGLPYEYFSLRKELPFIEEGSLEKN